MKNTKKWLVAAAVLSLVGAILFAGVMTVYGWDFMRLSTTAYETHTYVMETAFENIKIDTDTANISFVPSADGFCRVVCYEPEKEAHMAAVENGTLTVRLAAEKTWYDYIGITVETPRITVYLPKDKYGALSVTESTGDVDLPEVFMFDSLCITASTLWKPRISFMTVPWWQRTSRLW